MYSLRLFGWCSGSFVYQDQNTIQCSNKDNSVLRAGCQSPSSIRLCPEHSWISPGTCADGSQQAPPWADWICVTPTRQQHPVVTHRVRLGDWGTVSARQNAALSARAETLPGGEAVLQRSAGQSWQIPVSAARANLAKGSWLLIGIIVKCATKTSQLEVIARLLTNDSLHPSYDKINKMLKSAFSSF